MSSVSTLKRAQQLHKDLVFGFIRIQTRKKKKFMMNVPKLIDYLVLQYFYITSDVWDSRLISQGIRLRENTIICGSDQEADGTTSFGFETITFGTFKWKFRVDNLEGDDSSFGIIRVDNNSLPLRNATDTNGFFTEECMDYCYPTTIEYVLQYTPCNPGDVLIMELDLNNLKLNFEMNGFTETISIEQGHYKACVNLYWPNDSITLL